MPLTLNRHFSPPPCFATRCLWGNQRALVVESEVSELRWGRTTDQKWSQCLGRFVRHHPFLSDRLSLFISFLFHLSSENIFCESLAALPDHRNISYFTRSNVRPLLAVGEFLSDREASQQGVGHGVSFACHAVCALLFVRTQWMCASPVIVHSFTEPTLTLILFLYSMFTRVMNTLHALIYSCSYCFGYKNTSKRTGECRLHTYTY